MYFPENAILDLTQYARAFLNSKRKDLIDPFKELLEGKMSDEEFIKVLEGNFRKFKFSGLFPEIQSFIDKAKNGELVIPEEWIENLIKCFYVRRRLGLAVYAEEDPEIRSALAIGLEHPIVFSDVPNKDFGIYEARKGLTKEHVQKLLNARHVLIKAGKRDSYKHYYNVYVQLGLF